MRWNFCVLPALALLVAVLAPAPVRATTLTVYRSWHTSPNHNDADPNDPWAIPEEFAGFGNETSNVVTLNDSPYGTRIFMGYMNEVDVYQANGDFQPKLVVFRYFDNPDEDIAPEFNVDMLYIITLVADTPNYFAFGHQLAPSPIGSYFLSGNTLNFYGSGYDYGGSYAITYSFGLPDFAEGGGSSVPEPATWAMMLLGFGLIGGVMRASRRRQLLALKA